MLGIVLASTLVIIPVDANYNLASILMSAATFHTGTGLGLFMKKYEAKHKT